MPRPSPSPVAIRVPRQARRQSLWASRCPDLVSKSASLRLPCVRPQLRAAILCIRATESFGGACRVPGPGLTVQGVGLGGGDRRNLAALELAVPQETDNAQDGRVR